MFNHKKKEDLINEQISDIFFRAGTETEENSESLDSSSVTPSANSKSHYIFFIVLAICCCFVVMVVIISRLSHPAGKNAHPDSGNTSISANLWHFDNPVSEYLGTHEVSAEILSGKSMISGNFTIENLKEANNDVAGISLDFDLRHLAADKRLGLDLDIKYRSANALSADVYMDNTALLFKIPTKSEKVFSVNYDKALGRLKEKELSPFVDNLLSEDIVKNLSGNWSDLYGGLDIISLYYYSIKDGYPKEYIKIAESITTSASNPDTYGNSGTTYTLTEEGFEALVKCILTVTFENEYLYRMVYPTLVYAAGHNLIQTPASGEPADLTTTMDDILFNLRSSASAFALAHKGDFSFTVWQNSEGLITGISCDNDIKISEQILDLNFNMVTQNDLNPLNNAKCTLTLGYDSAIFNMILERTSEDSDLKKVNDHFYCDINGENSIEINRLSEVDTTDNSFEYKFSIVTPNEADNFSVTCDGEFSNIAKGKSLDVLLNKLYINDGFSNLMTLSGKLLIRTDSVKVDKLIGTRYELTDMSEEELKKLFGIATK